MKNWRFSANISLLFENDTKAIGTMEGE